MGLSVYHRLALLLLFGVFLFFFPLDSAGAGVFVFLLVFLFLVSRFFVFRFGRVSSELFVVAVPVLAFFFLYFRGFVLSAVFLLFGCFLFLPVARGYVRVSGSGLLLFGVFVFSLVLNSVTLNEDMVADYGWHLLFAGSFVGSFPHIPVEVPFMRGGMLFYYPPFSYFLLAFLKFVFPAVRLFFLGKFVMVFFESFVVFPVYFLARQLSGSRTAGVVAAFLFAISPFRLLFYQFSATVALPFLLFAVYFVLLSFERDPVRHSLAGVLLLLFGFMNHIIPSLVIAAFLILLTLWHSHSIRRLHFSFFAISAAIVFFMLLYFGGLYLLADFKPMDSFERRVVALETPATQDLVHFKYFLSDFPSLIAIGAAGAIHSLRNWRKWFPLYLFILSTLLWMTPPYLGLYLFSGSDRFATFLIASLSIFGGAFLARSLFFHQKHSFVFVFLLIVLLAPNILNATRQLKSTALSTNDEAAFNWIRENLEKNAAIISDNGHAYWMPAVAKRKVIGGKKDDLVSGDRRDLDVALVFSEADVSRKVLLMSSYGSRYVYFSNSTLRPFPYLTYEDVISSRPSVGVWANVSQGLGLFERPPFRRVFFMGGDDRIAIYELNA